MIESWRGRGGGQWIYRIRKNISLIGNNEFLCACVCVCVFKCMQVSYEREAVVAERVEKSWSRVTSMRVRERGEDFYQWNYDDASSLALRFTTTRRRKVGRQKERTYLQGHRSEAGEACIHKIHYTDSYSSYFIQHCFVWISLVTLVLVLCWRFSHPPISPLPRVPLLDSVTLIAAWCVTLSPARPSPLPSGWTNVCGNGLYTFYIVRAHEIELVSRMPNVSRSSTV